MTRKPLTELNDWELVHDDQDLRGAHLRDMQGHDIGKIDRMIVNTDLGYVDAFVLEDGREIPVDQVEIHDDHAVLLGTGTTRTTTTQSTTRESTQADQGEMRLPVIEEELAIGKRQVERGGVRIHTRIREKPVEETVTLREETVHVDRQPVNRPASQQDLERAREGTFEVREVDEKAVVNKQARVTEEVRVSKEAEEHTETIKDEVRRTDVDVEPARKRTSR